MPLHTPIHTLVPVLWLVARPLVFLFLRSRLICLPHGHTYPSLFYKKIPFIIFSFDLRRFLFVYLGSRSMFRGLLESRYKFSWVLAASSPSGWSVTASHSCPWEVNQRIQEPWNLSLLCHHGTFLGSHSPPSPEVWLISLFFLELNVL